MSLAQRVAKFIRRYGLTAPGMRVGVAVSGGADSMCLLHILLDLREELELELAVVHFDHRLRPESAEDAAFVHKQARRYGLEFFSEEADTAGEAARIGENLEQYARDLRRNFFARLIEDGDLDRIAAGHTLSDQAETVLLRFLRGAGNTGLAGILPLTREGVMRPLLDIHRDEVREYLSGRGFAWREDTSNADMRFSRNRIRRELIPLLRESFNPALEQRLGQMAEIAREEEDYWRRLVRRTATSGILQTLEIRKLHPALARRAIRHAIAEARGDLRQIEFQHIEQVRELIRSSDGDGRVQLPGLEVHRSFEWVRFSPSPGEETSRFPSTSLKVPGTTYLPQAAVRICTLLLESASAESGYNIEDEAKQGKWDRLDWDKVTHPLTLRRWMPGDRYRPVGHLQPQKLKHLLHSARIPLWDRTNWPIIQDSNGIIWSRRFGPSADFQSVPSQSTRTLLVREDPAP